MGKKIMWRSGEFWGIKSDNSFRLETASAQLDVFNACEASEGDEGKFLARRPSARELRAGRNRGVCLWQADFARMMVQVESEIREKMRKLYERTGEIVA